MKARDLFPYWSLELTYFFFFQWYQATSEKKQHVSFCSFLLHLTEVVHDQHGHAHKSGHLHVGAQIIIIKIPPKLQSNARLLKTPRLDFTFGEGGCETVEQVFLIFGRSVFINIVLYIAV